VLDDAMLIPLSDIREVTARNLDFNDPDRVLERQTVHGIGRYPSAAALVRMTEHT
jgi:hypothetical protein